jgi:hypothetical protein
MCLFRQLTTAFPPQRIWIDFRSNRSIKYISLVIWSNATTKTNRCSLIAMTVRFSDPVWTLYRDLVARGCPRGQLLWNGVAL